MTGWRFSHCADLFHLAANSVLFQIWSAGFQISWFFDFPVGWSYLQSGRARMLLLCGGSQSLVYCLSFLFDVRVCELTSRDGRKQEHFKPTTLVIVWCMENNIDRSESPAWQRIHTRVTSLHLSGNIKGKNLFSFQQSGAFYSPSHFTAS